MTDNLGQSPDWMQPAPQVALPAPNTIGDIFAKHLPFYKHYGRWFVGQHGDTDCHDQVEAAKAELSDLLLEAGITELHHISNIFTAATWDASTAKAVVEDRIQALRKEQKT